MDGWRERPSGDPLPWLLEDDAKQPAVRYFTLRDILGGAEDDREVSEAMEDGVQPQRQDVDGYRKEGAAEQVDYVTCSQGIGRGLSAGCIVPPCLDSGLRWNDSRFEMVY